MSPPSPSPSSRSLQLYLLSSLAAISNLLFGYDTGIVSGSMLLVRKDFHLTDFWHELIVSVTVGTAWLGALLGGPSTDKFGRKPVILVAGVLFVIGSATMAAAGTKEILLVGRLIVGLGIGLSSMSVPIYISESAPVAIRGLLVTLATACITLGQLVSGLVSGALSTTEHGWRWMLGLGAVPAALQLVGFAFMPMSPRFLVSTGRVDQAEQVLRRIRSSDADVARELAAIQTDFAAQQSLLLTPSGETRSTLREVLRRAATRRALLAGCFLQLFQQISGVNTVVYYSASIITLAGVRDTSTAIWLSCIVSLLSFAFKFVGMALVERIGRRQILLWSTVGSTLALILLGAGFQISAANSPKVEIIGTDSSCASFSTCSDCENGGVCGFCFRDLAVGPANGSCLPLVSSYNSSAETGRCANASALGVNSLTWASNWCPTDYAWIPITGMFLYISLYSPGLGAMPWTITSEVYPLWARSTCNSITTAVNWAFNLLVSLTFLTLTHAITRQGTFYMFAGCTALGLAVFYLTIPETMGVPLEEMDTRFSEPWGLHAPRLPSRLETEEQAKEEDNLGFDGDQ